MVGPVLGPRWVRGCFIGSALLPDLDGKVSTAGYQLGVFGSTIRVFMVSFSSLIYSLVKTKKDDTNTFHRMFFHTPFSVILIYLYCYICTKNLDNKTMWGLIRNGEILNINFIFYIFLIFIIISSFYLFINKLCYHVSFIIPRKVLEVIKSIIFIFFIFYTVVKASPQHLFTLSGAVCLGWLSHIIADFFSKGSVPIFFPIPVKKRFWYKPMFPFQVETGGFVNKTIDLALFVISVLLIIFILGGEMFLKNLLK